MEEIVDQKGSKLGINDKVTFIHEKKGILTGKIVAFSPSGKVFVDYLSLHGKTWEHEYFQREGEQVCKIQM